MKQVFVAAWVGISVGWMGFGWVLAEAPMEGAQGVAMAEMPAPVGGAYGAFMAAGVDILQEQQIVGRGELNPSS